MNNLLVETNIFQPVKGTLLEGKLSNRGNPLVEGILATAEIENGNGRYYSKGLWEREIDKYQTNISENRAVGELDHPDTTVINLKNVSHNILDIWWDGNNIMGKLEILPTPSGNILKALIESNITVGVSSRGTGSLKSGAAVMEVQDDFELLCWDFVSTPSNPGSYMNVLKEGLTENLKDYSKAHKTIQEILCSFGSCPV
jgi:hypothetical protein|tara:strand:+ start:231 stop:830 length:600 start_codon:yes stop_codon:yes gene_type:complete